MLSKIKLNNISRKHQVLIILGLGLLAFAILITGYFQVFLNTPASKEKKEIEFVIKSGEGVRAIASNLEENNLIKNDFPFLVYLKVSGHVADLKAGYYKISTSNTPLEIVDILTKGKVASRKITVPEGWNNREIAEYLEKQEIVNKADFLAATKEKYDYDFLKDLPEGASVEGFLFPDTYQIPYQADAKYIVNVMLENFDKKLTSELKDQIKATNYSIYEVINLSSIVEDEVSKPQDRKLVAGIFLARLQEGMPLQSCVTLQYIYGSNKKIFSYDETKVDSPYNTYQNSGLPKGPVSNPGIESINSVIYPEKTAYRYFLSSEGTTYYAKTLEEHEANKAKYLNE